jgi:hypothetical protein
MILIFISYFLIKSLSSFVQPSPYQRGSYESFFTSLSKAYPTLWSRAGPRPYIRPTTLISRLQWHLINRWATPDADTTRFSDGRKIVSTKPTNDSDGTILDHVNDISVWTRCKHTLIRHWSGQIATHIPSSNAADFPREDGFASSLGLADSRSQNVIEMLALPASASNMLAMPPDARLPRLREPTRPGSLGSSGQQSRGSSAGGRSEILVEEEEVGWLRRISGELDGRARNLSQAVWGATVGGVGAEERKME